MAQVRCINQVYGLYKQPRNFSNHTQLNNRFIKVHLKKTVRQVHVKAEEIEQEEEPISTIFNPEFSKVLKEALTREGEDKLYQPSQDAILPQENVIPRKSAMIEVLIAAINQSRQNILRLKDIFNTVGQQLKEEQKQLERLSFLIQKAQGDNAYLAVIEQQLKEEREKNKA